MDYQKVTVHRLSFDLSSDLQTSKINDKGTITKPWKKKKLQVHHPINVVVWCSNTLDTLSLPTIGYETETVTFHFKIKSSDFLEKGGDITQEGG